MSDLNEHESEFSQLLRGVPVDDSVRAEHRDALRERALAVFDEGAASATFPRWQLAWNQGKELMRRPLPRLVAVVSACAVIVSVDSQVEGAISGVAQVVGNLDDFRPDASLVATTQLDFAGVRVRQIPMPPSHLNVRLTQRFPQQKRVMGHTKCGGRDRPSVRQGRLPGRHLVAR